MYILVPFFLTSFALHFRPPFLLILLARNFRSVFLLRPLGLHERSGIDDSGGPVRVLHGDLLAGVLRPRHRPLAGGGVSGGKGGHWPWGRDGCGSSGACCCVLRRGPGSVPAGGGVEALPQLSNGDW